MLFYSADATSVSCIGRLKKQLLPGAGGDSMIDDDPVMMMTDDPVLVVTWCWCQGWPATGGWRGDSEAGEW